MVVGKWKGTAVLAAETAWLCSSLAPVMPPGLPTKFSKKCLTHPTPESWVWAPFLTPPPIEVAPKPILYSHNTQAMSTRENPANIMASTFTAHFFWTIDA